ncbi:MAG: 30S ribosomal protein S20 [Selenomonadaceae bacterium]|nr:30S ribosomal protein S20 [Selenomonadaceae bacterium]
MPNIKASVKSIKQDAKRRARNVLAKNNIKKASKKVLEAIANNNVTEAKSLLALADKAIDKAVSSSTIHRNAAARKKSKLAKKVNALGA